MILDALDGGVNGGERWTVCDSFIVAGVCHPVHNCRLCLPLDVSIQAFTRTRGSSFSARDDYRSDDTSR